MAVIDLLIPKILKFEGGFVNDKDDPGGATNMGVTLSTWTHFGHDIDGDGKITANDIKLLNKEDFKYVLKVGYWDRWQADRIKNQSIAEILVDWLWGSGKYGITIPQRLMGLKEDGIVGDKTITTLNLLDQKSLFSSIVEARLKYIEDIIKVNPVLVKYRIGWRNRVLGYKFSN